jgi:uncharacterized membrane protein YbhN (UPF0104 family)
LALLFALVSGPDDRLDPGRLYELLAGAPAAAYLTFALLHLAGAAFRALRFSLLLRAGGTTDPPRFFPMLLVTGVRNMVVDLLPARLGELVYVGLLNRGYRVGLDTCLSSLATSVWLDIVVLFPLLVALGAISGWRSEALALVAAAAVFLAVLGLAGYLVLFRGLPGMSHAVERRLADRPGRLLRRLGTLLASVSQALQQTRDWGILGRALLLSFGVRACKYGGLLVLFFAIANSAGNSLSAAEPFSVLLALVSSEASASLPIPAFMSFGTYEAGGTAAFAALGFPAAEAAATVFSMHLASQVLDYGVGLLCLLLFFLTVRRVNRTRT